MLAKAEPISRCTCPRGMVVEDTAGDPHLSALLRGANRAGDLRIVVTGEGADHDPVTVVPGNLVRCVGPVEVWEVGSGAANVIGETSVADWNGGGVGALVAEVATRRHCESVVHLVVVRLVARLERERRCVGEVEAGTDCKGPDRVSRGRVELPAGKDQHRGEAGDDARGCRPPPTRADTP